MSQGPHVKFGAKQIADAAASAPEEREGPDATEQLSALFAGVVGARTHAPTAIPKPTMRQGHGPQPYVVHRPSSASRIVPSSDFGVIQDRKTEGVPSIGLAPPGQPEQGEAPPVQQMRQLTGLAPNSRSNTFLFTPSEWGDPSSGSPPVTTREVVIPFFQYNGAIDDTDLVVITLGLKLSQPSTNTNPDNFMIRAVIRYGVGNSGFDVEVDWKIGATIAIPANFLSLSARIPATSIAHTPPFTLSAGASYGSVPTHPSRSTFTISTGLALANLGNLQTFDIPARAISFGLGPQSFDPAFVGPLLALVAGTAAISSIAKATPDGKDLLPTTFPVPNGTTTIGITNLDPNVNMAACLIFELDI